LLEMLERTGGSGFVMTFVNAAFHGSPGQQACGWKLAPCDVCPPRGLYRQGKMGTQ
jgi:hypothetical protein